MNQASNQAYGIERVFPINTQIRKENRRRSNRLANTAKLFALCHTIFGLMCILCNIVAAVWLYIHYKQ
ncbi:MAG: hypothetical protein EAZ82_12275 [Verrucomicrobia bacterium]|nr:MAG: hypothetical protein EAZ82_12275 [Verrucomicrobiota bacterium]